METTPFVFYARKLDEILSNKYVVEAQEIDRTTKPDGYQVAGACRGMLNAIRNLAHGDEVAKAQARSDIRTVELMLYAARLMTLAAIDEIRRPYEKWSVHA